MIKILLLLPMSFLFMAASAQTTLSPEIIASGGGISKFSGVELEWTLGESVIGSASSSDRFYTIGFHQPILISHDTKQPAEIISSAVSIFPNPVSNMLKVQLQNAVNETMTLTLSDVQGRPFYSKTITGKSAFTEIPLKHLMSGMYMLYVYDSHKNLVNSFKIIKAN